MKIAFALLGLMALVTTARMIPDPITEWEIQWQNERAYLSGKISQVQNRGDLRDGFSDLRSMFNATGIVFGSVPGRSGQFVTLWASDTGVEDLEATMSQEALARSAKSVGLAGLALSGHLGGGLGDAASYILFLMTLGAKMETHQLSQKFTDAAKNEKCLGIGRQPVTVNETRTYKDLCDCDQNILSHVMGRMNNCRDTAAIKQSPSDQEKAIAFCANSVLCVGYDNGGTQKIIKNDARYDPLREFWCKSKFDQVALTLNREIGEALHSSLLELDFDKFRTALREPCIGLLQKNSDSTAYKCPTKAEIESANSAYPPVAFCTPGMKPRNKPV